MSVRRITTSAGLSLLLIASWVGPLTPPAAACSCMSDDRPDPAQALDYDAVFVGRIEAFRDNGRLEDAVWYFDVSGVYKGDVRKVQAVSSGPATCEWGLPKRPTRKEFIVFADRGSEGVLGGLQAGLCGPTRAVADRAPDFQVAAAAPDPSAFPIPTIPTDSPSGTNAWPLAALSVAVLVLGAFAGRSRRRRLAQRDR